eukprot:CAMPEP_0117594188 /NCGR_PEP_ID=MMETSP0784-20121206/73057_1 /TAXON_ID=39447 /ORGANISM="" /LENGTH=271 /DNA_ID=CAMNT_0005396209 /DNA_START=110 /DNA_END=922 /DNA_ORIENTATION=-
MTTISIMPPVFLLRSDKGSVLGWANDDIIGLAQGRLHPSGEKHYDPNRPKSRTSLTAYLPSGGRQDEVKRRVQTLLRLETHDQVENLQVVKYEANQYHRQHQDFFVKSEAREYYEWTEWLRAQNKTVYAKALETSDPRLHPDHDLFARALYEAMVERNMFNNQDRYWVGASHTAEEFKHRWRHVLGVSPVTRLAKRAFASAMRRPELVMPEEPMDWNRMATLFAYLSDDFDGGATGFVDLDARDLPSPTPPEVVHHESSLEECKSSVLIRP